LLVLHYIVLQKHYAGWGLMQTEFSFKREWNIRL